jgi:epoxyqueuosine reductase
MPTSTSEHSVKPSLIAQAEALGFDAIGITTPGALGPAPDRLRAFLAAGGHGEMGWLAEKAERRANPSALLPGLGTIVMLGMNYGPADDPRARLLHPDRGVIAAYAGGDDYHDVVKGKLKSLGRWLCATHGGDARVYVDTAPVMEKPLAAAAGIGWQGKHTNLVSRTHGSWLFLGALFTTLVLEADVSHADNCGSCRACLDACPTNAFPAPYRLDARRCISYLTIETKGPIPREFRAAMGNRIYGCDDCLAACPWNKYAHQAREQAFHARAALQDPALADLARLDDAAFRALFRKSPVKRTGRDRFVRNVMIALGNSGDAAQLRVVEERLTDSAPLVRGAAIWALSRLAPAAVALWRDRLLPQESDADVRHEWGQAA